MSRRLSGWGLMLLVLSLAALGPVRAAGPEPMAWWKLDDGSGTIAKDSSGNGHDGTVIGGPTWVPGVFRGALRFNGVDQYVEVPHDPGLTVDTEVTVMAWINPERYKGGATASNTWQGIIGKGNNPRSYSFFTMDGATLHFSVGPSSGYYGSVSTGTINLNEWSHVTAMVIAGQHQYYINGEDAGRAQSNVVLPGAASTDPVYFGRGAAALANTAYLGMIDDVRIYNVGLSQQEVQQAMRGDSAPLAASPDPANDATDVPRDAGLSWLPGEVAASHTVYMGTSFADVNQASVAQPGGVRVEAGLSATTLDPGPLDFGQTYYWRVDEVNGPPDNTVFKGEIWSFTVEPYAYPIVPIAATASSFQPDLEPTKTIDGSGLTGDVHGVEPTTMWMSAGTQPNWIQYEFDEVYKLHELAVWNSNQVIEAFLGFGARSVTIETSSDGTTWTPVANVPEFSQAPGAPGYAANTVVALGGTMARFVKLTINSNWGGIAPQSGLSEVRFFRVPLEARAPMPADRATEVGLDTVLDWRPGRDAASHAVYLGTDPNAVAAGTVAGNSVTDHSYVPDGLDLATTYYWKVEEVGTVTYPGDLWSFRTQEYQVVEDFETYTSEPGQEVFMTWIDGFDNPTKNGGVVGLATAVGGTFCDGTTFHGGRFSAPFAYDNTQAPLSEATRTFAPAQNWTASGIKSLSLWFQGAVGNTGQLYVKINDTKVSYAGSAADLAQATWTTWNIDLSKASKVNSVRSLTIGIEGAGAQGTLHFDDIRLYPKTPEYITPVAPDPAGLQAHYAFEGDASDSSGKGRHGTLQGGVTFMAGKVGQALRFDGMDDTVTVAGYQGVLADAAGIQHAFTVSAWIKTAVNAMDIVAWGTNAAGQRLNFRVDTVLRLEHGNGNMRGTNGPSLLDDEWHHVAATVPEGATIMDVALYVDGRDVSAAASSAVAFNLTAGVDVTIGSGGSVAARFFQGLIDEVRIYDRVLSAGEVAGLAGLTVPYDKPF